MVEQQAEELCIDTARGGEGGRHESNALVIRIVRLVLRNFFPGRIPEGLVKVGRAAQLTVLAANFDFDKACWAYTSSCRCGAGL